ncbi:MAG: hypothetical protein IPK55_12195 [Streptococcus sp.]|nr:hypothetical protein [Streptococcus sp.]
MKKEKASMFESLSLMMITIKNLHELDTWKKAKRSQGHELEDSRKNLRKKKEKIESPFLRDDGLVQVLEHEAILEFHQHKLEALPKITGV